MKKIMKLSSIFVALVLVLSACTAAPTAAPAPVEPTSAPATSAPAPTIAPTTAPAQAEPAAAATAVKPTVAPTKMPTPDRSDPKELFLATTTSTRDSGLLDVLLPMFEKSSGYKVKMIAVGSGQAMTLGSEGNADVLLVHSPAAEKDFMTKEFGKDRLLVMHNDFIVVGPAEDPAKIKGMKSPIDAFKAIAAAKAVFASRADKSGTNSAELALWKKAGLAPAKTDEWYLQTGSGMGDTLRITSEKGGYTLSDRATFLAQKESMALEILIEGDSSLLNVYHVITVNPDKFPMVNKDGAKAFADFMVNKDTQAVIGTFGVEKYKQPLFFPDADKTDKDLGL